MSRTFRFAWSLTSAVAALAACCENPVAPATADIPDAAMARIKFPQTVLVSARTVTTIGAPASIWVRFTSGTTTSTTTETVVEAEHNSALELDSRKSYVQVRIVKSDVYRAKVSKGDALLCKGGAPKVIMTNGNVVDFGSLVLKYNPSIEIRNFDGSSMIGGPAACGTYHHWPDDALGQPGE